MKLSEELSEVELRMVMHSLTEVQMGDKLDLNPVEHLWEILDQHVKHQKRGLQSQCQSALKRFFILTEQLNQNQMNQK